MNKDKVQNNIDGTKLFEKLSKNILSEYLGRRSTSIIFGTANSNSFENKVSDLIKRLHLGGSFINPDAKSASDYKDDGVDIVAWIDFADRKNGKLILAGQCKTGTSWRDKHSATVAKSFFSLWFSNKPRVEAVPVLLITDSPGYKSWNHDLERYGLIFNRSRLLDFFPDELDSSIFDEVINWNAGAIDLIKKKI